MLSSPSYHACKEKIEGGCSICASAFVTLKKFENVITPVYSYDSHKFHKNS